MCDSNTVCGNCGKTCYTFKKSEGFDSFEFWGRAEHTEIFSTLSTCCNSEDVYSSSEAFEVLGDEHLQQELF